MRWTISNGPCGSFDEVTLINNVDPFVIAPSNQVLCSGSMTTAVTFAGNASQYSWTNDSPSIGLPASGVGNIASFMAFNSSGSPVIATITITPTSGICTGTQQSFTITVNPIPVIDPIANIATGTGVVVGPIALTTNTLGGENFSWSGGAAVGLPDGSGSSPIPSFTTINSGVTPISATVSVIATKNGCPGPTLNFNITVYPVPGALAGDQNICTGDYSSVLITATVVGTTFTWTVGTVTGTVTGQAPGSGPIIAQQLTSVAGGVVEYIITPTANGVMGPTASVFVGVLPTPLGNSVSAGTYKFCSGTLLGITPTSSVSGSTYTWTGNNGSGGSGDITDTPINTINNPIDITYTIIPTGPSPTFCAGSPFTIVVTVNPNPSFTVTNNAPTICSGSNASIVFNSSTTGHQINVVSVNYNGAGNSGTIVPGTTIFTNGNTLTEALTNSTNAPIDVVYTFNVTTPSTAPACPLIPVNQTVTVRVYPVPNASAATPQTICSGSNTSVTIINPNAVSGTTFTWTVVGPSNVTGASAGSGTLISQFLTSTDGISTGTLTYRIIPTANGCSGSPFDVVVNVTPRPTITNPATNFIQDICSATALNFIPTSSVAGTNYTWTSSVIGTLSGVSASGSGAITDTPVNATSSNAVIIYTITPFVSGCAGNPVNVVVTVHPVPNVFASNQIICSNSSTSIVISNPNLVSGTTYTWTALATNTNGSSSGSGNSISQVLASADGLSNGTVDYTITPHANGCAGVPITITVTVKPVPVLTNTPASFSQQICSGQTLAFTPTANIGGTSFTWTSVITGTINSGSVTTSGSGPITDTPVNTGNTSGTIRYTIIPTLNSCSGVPIDLIVTVKPQPSASGSNVIICSGQNAIINILPTPVSVSGTTFSWTASPSSNVVGSANGNGSTINQILSTTDALIGTVAYSITPAANGCNGPITIISATINPIAIVNAGTDFSVCETLSFPGTAMTIPINGTIGGSAATGTWTIISGAGSISPSTTGVGGVVTATYTVGGGDIASQVKLRLTTNDPDLGGPCSIVFDDLAIDVHKRARVALPSNYSVCEPPSINLNGTLMGSSSSGLWSLVSPGVGTLSASSVTGGLTVNASYFPAYSPGPSDVNTTLIFRLTTNDPDGFGPCTNEFADINIHINESAKVNAGADFEVCEDQVVNLNGSFSGSTTNVTWSLGGGAFGDATNPITTYTLTPANIAANGVTLRLTTNNPGAPCGIVSDDVFIKINKKPTVQIFNLLSVYAENDPQVPMAGVNNSVNGGTDVFTGPGVIAGTNIFDPANADKAPLLNTITYTFTDGVTGCFNSVSKDVLVNQVTAILFHIDGEHNYTATTAEICSNVGLSHLRGEPGVTDPLAKSASFSSSDIPARIQKIGLEYFIDTDGLAPGNYFVTYTFTNQADATETLTKVITVFPAPVAIIGVGDNCIDGVVTFLQSSVMSDGSDPDDASTGIRDYNWLYGEGATGSFGTVKQPTYTYPTSGSKNVILELITYHECRNTATKTILIGTPPIPDFTRSSYCKGDVTQFTDKSTATVSPINSYSWDFGDGNISSVQNPTNTYGNFGTFDVKLTIGTTAGCTADTTKTIFILDSPAAMAVDPYSIDFESGNGSWVSVIDYDLLGDSASWVFGLPTGDIIKTAASGNNAWWTGGNSGTYYNSEKSYVIGPCLNIQELKRPMISLNYWSDTQGGFDGAVVQYSTNGGADWTTLGDANGRGINWYNTRDVIGKPGGFNNYAWTDTTNRVDSKWKNARFNLEQINPTQRDTVIFRIAFGSNSDNPSGVNLNGFAFDDIYIGEKTRNVLVEHFTNDASTPSGLADDYLDLLYSKSYNFSGRDSSDFIKLQYHMANPGADQINADNPDDPSARRLYYRLSEPPVTIMDGIIGQYYNTNFNGSYAYITDEEVDRRALEDPTFDITIDTLAAANNTLDLQLNYTYIDTLNSLSTPVILHAALIESGFVGSDLKENKNYVRKLLLQGEGRLISKAWTVGVPEVIPVNYTIDVPIKYPDSLSIIAFVQDRNSGRILQTVIKKIKRKVGPVVVGVPDDPTTSEIAGLNIYPNPASNTLNLQLDNQLHYDYAWKMIDQRGIVVLEGNLNRDLSTPQKVELGHLADGIYFMAIQSGEKSVVYRKIAVINRD
ncbi:MAG: PKD-like domain-containing protein [Chryseolinea sp.]